MSPNTGNLYEVLGVPKDASEIDIVKAYRRKARKYHPDVSTEKDAEEQFKKIKEAYEILRDPDRRAHYDATGGTAPEDINPPQDILMSLMKDALSMSVDMPMISIHATVNHSLNEIQDKINARIAQIKEAVEVIKRRRGSVRRKGKGVNLFHVVVDREIKMLVDYAERKLPDLIKHVGEARRIFNDYEKDQDFYDVSSTVLMLMRESFERG